MAEKLDGEELELVLALVAHEIRTPLSAIINAARLATLAEKNQNAVRGYLEVIDRQSQHLNSMIDSIVRLCRAKTGTGRLEEECISGKTLVNSAISMASQIVAARGLAISCSFEGEDPCVRGDAGLLAQVIFNILQNAAKYSAPKGEISLRVKRGREHALISIKDSGRGIDRSEQSQIFRLFGQAEPTASMFDSSLGIGLYLAEQTVRLHGGRIKVRSKGIDQGTEFILAMPYKDRCVACDRCRNSQQSAVSSQQSAVSSQQKIMFAGGRRSNCNRVNPSSLCSLEN